MCRTLPTSVELHITVTSWISDDQTTRLQSLLSDAEQARASRFQHASDRRDYVAAHAILRLHLGQHQQCRPESLEFAANENGKPALVSGSDSAPANFSLSHTRGCVGIAIDAQHDCGLDIEAYDNVVDIEELIPSVLSGKEQEFMARFSVSKRRRTFTKFWTLKESLLKASGAGLDRIPNDIEFAIDGDIPRLLDATADAKPWAFDSSCYADEFHLSLCYKTGTSVRRPKDARENLELFMSHGIVESGQLPGNKTGH